MKFQTIISFIALLVSSLALIPEKDLKPNVFVLTDISNEPDDAGSLVRLLLYTNELNLKGIVATTSYWLNDTIHDEDIYPIVDAYEEVQPQLLKHSKSYPSADYIRSIVSTGKPVYGLKALEDDELSQGAKNLIAEVDKLDEDETLFVLVWGGANVIAESLNSIKKSRSDSQITEFINKLIIYAISDQDNSGPWIRYNFPKLKYIVSIHGFNQYGHSAWVGISGEAYNHFDEGGPDYEKVSLRWVKDNVRSVGALGNAYPPFLFLMEGDTPSTLFVLPNGLNDPHHVEYGGWGGRYTPSDLHGDFGHYGDAQDQVIGLDGKLHVSNKASIWRWRDDFQNDFAARIQWTVKDFKDASHQPIVVANETTSYLPFEIEADVASKVVLDVSKSYDLNDRKLSFKWFHYREITATQGNLLEVPQIDITNVNDEGSIVEFELPDFKQACFDLFQRPLSDCRTYHLIVEVSNDGEPSVISYRRFILKTRPGPDDKFDTKNATLQQEFFHSHDEL